MPSQKLTGCTWKLMDNGRLVSFWDGPIVRGRIVSFRECTIYMPCFLVANGTLQDTQCRCGRSQPPCPVGSAVGLTWGDDEFFPATLQLYIPRKPRIPCPCVVLGPPVVMLLSAPVESSSALDLKDAKEEDILKGLQAMSPEDRKKVEDALKIVEKDMMAKVARCYGCSSGNGDWGDYDMKVRMVTWNDGRVEVSLVGQGGSAYFHVPRPCFRKGTLPETDRNYMKIGRAHLKGNEKVFQPSIFRCFFLISFRESNRVMYILRIAFFGPKRCLVNELLGLMFLKLPNVPPGWSWRWPCFQPLGYLAIFHHQKLYQNWHGT